MSRVELDTAPLEELQDRLRELRRLRGQVGIFREAGDHGPGLSVAQLGAFHEFGLGVPERSFLRSTFLARRGDAGEAMGRAVAQVVGGDDPERALGRQVEAMAGWVKIRIRERIAPPLSPATLRRKTVQGKVGDVPLVDTGQLIQSIAARVVTA